MSEAIPHQPSEIISPCQATNKGKRCLGTDHPIYENMFTNGERAYRIFCRKCEYSTGWRSTFAKALSEWNRPKFLEDEA